MKDIRYAIYAAIVLHMARKILWKVSTPQHTARSRKARQNNANLKPPDDIVRTRGIDVEALLLDGLQKEISRAFMEESNKWYGGMHPGVTLVNRWIYEAGDEPGYSLPAAPLEH